MNKHLVSTALLGTSLLFAAGVGATESDLSGALGVDAAAMSGAELAQVAGKGHGDTALGALLLSLPNADKRAATPAWSKGLSPDRAMGKAQVGKNRN